MRTTGFPVTHGTAGPSDPRPPRETGASKPPAAAGPYGGDTLGWETGVALSPARCCIEPAPAATTDSGGHRERAPGTGHWVRLPALIATLASLERKSVLMRILGAVSIPDFNTARDLTPTATSPTEHQALSARPPSANAQHPAPVTRVPVVLLPHAQTPPPSTRPAIRRAVQVTGINHNQSPRHQPAHRNATTPVIAARQWHDAERAMKVARHSFDRWLTASDQDAASMATMHAHHTRTAVHEAARTIATLVDILDDQTTEPTTTPT
jgi:hypothetical protein